MIGPRREGSMACGRPKEERINTPSIYVSGINNILFQGC